MNSRRAQFTEMQGGWGSAVPAALSLRMPPLVGCKGSAVEKMGALKVLAGGGGSVGGAICEKLARHGVAELWVVDPKSYKAESLATHGILPEEVGQGKAFAVAGRCKAISPGTRVLACAGLLQDVPLSVLLEVDVVILATDNLAVVAAAGQVCRHLGTPLLQAAVFGDTLTAQVKVWGNGSESTACPACGFGPLEWQQLSQSMVWSCDGGAVRLDVPPTMSTPHLCSTAADLCMNQLLRLVLKLGKPVDDTLVDYCGYTNQIVTSPLAINTSCRCDHARWELGTAPRPLRDCSLQELRAAAGLASAEPVTFEVHGAEWVEKALCGCAQPAFTPRFMGSGKSTACASCGEPFRALSFFAQKEVEAARLGAAVEKPLAQLGVDAPEWVLLRVGDRALLFIGKPKQN